MIACLTTLVACTSKYQPEQELASYVKALSRSEYVSVVVPKYVSPPLYPTLKTRQRALTKFDVSILDFLSLQRCEVGYLAGEKNSVLGRVMENSQRFLYEVNMIRAIESCHIDDQDLSTKLAHVAKVKRQELHLAFTNAIFNGAEAEAFFSVSNGFIPLSNSMANYQDLFASLKSLRDVGKQMEVLPRIDRDVFEGDLKRMADSEYAGQLLYSMVQLTRYLNAVASAIEALPSSVCGAPVSFLKQQFTQHYIQIIQPYMARINSSAYKVLPVISALASIGEPLPKALRQYLNLYSLVDENSTWNLYQKASQRHAHAWSQLFSRCSVSLG